MKGRVVAYKFVKPCFADAFPAGKFPIGTPAYYANYDGPLVDKLDAGVSHEVGFARGHDPLIARLLGGAGGGLVGNPNAYFTDVHFIHQVPCFISCFARRPENSHLEARGLTAVLKIHDLGALAEKLRENSYGRLGAWTAGTVVYQEREFHIPTGWTNAPVHHANAFVKRPQYAPEEELRIVWDRLGGEEEWFLSQEWDASQLVERIR